MKRRATHDFKESEFRRPADSVAEESNQFTASAPFKVLTDASSMPSLRRRDHDQSSQCGEAHLVGAIELLMLETSRGVTLRFRAYPPPHWRHRTDYSASIIGSFRCKMKEAQMSFWKRTVMARFGGWEVH